MREKIFNFFKVAKKKGKDCLLLGRLPKAFKRSERFWLFVTVVLAVVFSLFLFFLMTNLPSPRRLSTYPFPASTSIYDRNGQLLYEIYGNRNRVPVKLDQVPEDLVKATLAIEDKNFYSHHGFDFKGIGRAAYSIVFRRRLQGGSTVTQQLVKNALLTPERTWRRKVKEAVLTFLTEFIYSKDQILEMYFNQTPYGGTAWGVQVAAKAFFGKDIADLTLAESALLAGLPAAPTRFSPFIHPDLATSRQRLVLERMWELGMISEAQRKKAANEELRFALPGAKIKAPHFVFYVKEKLVDEFGQAAVEQGGLKVKTTLDLSVQREAQRVVANEIAKLKSARVSNGAVLVTNPKTGQILAMVGSKDYFARDIDGKFNVTTALRQPGSAIKPINYAIGLNLRKITAATVFNDTPVCFLITGQKPYCPRNYDGLFHGPVQMRYALGNSFNIPAVKMLAINGLDTFVASASAMGMNTFKDPSSYGLSLTLGGGEVRMTDMAIAFGSLANAGVKQDPVAILEVKDRAGRVLDKFEPSPGPQVISKEAAWVVSDVLSDNDARSAAFGPSSWLVVKDHPEVSVKTGTTNDKRDNWTIGYTPSMVVVVWVGNNDNSPMGAVASGVTGASPIWNKVTSFVLKGKKQEWPVKPSGIVGRSVCNLTGALPPSEGCQLRFEYFLAGTEPTGVKPIKRSVLIDKVTGQPIQPGEDKPDTEYQDHSVAVDPLGVVLCLDCSPPPEGYRVNLLMSKVPLEKAHN